MFKLIRSASTSLRHSTVRQLVLTSKIKAQLLPSLAVTSVSRTTYPNISPVNHHPFSTATSSSLQYPHPTGINQPSNNNQNPRNNRVYSWIDAEAESLIAKAYERHLTKQQDGLKESYPPSLSVADLEKLGKAQHFEPQDWVDKMAYGLMRFLRVFTHAFFREKYDHHAVTLETVAAVPGIVAAFHRHLRSLRRMRRDHGWIKHLLEESENERMHLLIFMKVTNPSPLERAIVILAQAAYLSFYSALYLINGRAAHRLVGYLEEEASFAYTDYIKALDDGRLKMKPAPEIARQYYKLPDDATIRDVVLHVRADEAMHRDTNHHLANKIRQGDIDTPPVTMSKYAVEIEKEAEGKKTSADHRGKTTDDDLFEGKKPTVVLSTGKQLDEGGHDKQPREV